MEELTQIIEIADTLQYGILPFIIGGLALAGGAIKYGGARKAELKANKASREADKDAQAAANALAAREARSFVPGFGDSDNIPGYGPPNQTSMGRTSSAAARQRNLDRRDRALGRPIPRRLGGIQDRPVFERFRGDDVGDRASMTVIPDGGNPMARGFQEAMRRGDGIAGVSRRGQNVISELLRRRFQEVTANLPKSADGKPIFPDPNTSEGKNFYSKLPKSVADMANDPRMAQMYKGSNIVNPYANVRDISGIAEDVSDLLRDRTDLLSDRTDLIQDRTDLLSDRSGLFESAVPLGADLSAGLTDLSIGQEDLSGRTVDLRRGAQDFSGLASDTSVLTSNAFANLQVATQAADLQAQQSDQALANTLSTIRATGAGAGGATAIAQAALQSKLNISATIEQQEARNVQARAQGQQQVEMIRMNEGRRLQDIALSEKLRLEGLREREGLRLDETRLGEGRALRDLAVSEGRRLQDLGISEGRRLQDLAISERLREQGLSLDESLRLQEARFGMARDIDRTRFDEAGRLQQASFDEAGRLQNARAQEQIRLQNARMAEQQRLQTADAMAREYQFRVAETREQNRLNRLQDMQTQAAASAADLEAAKVGARAQRQGALAGAFTGLAQTGVAAYGAGLFGD